MVITCELPNTSNGKIPLCDVELNTEKGFHGSVYFFLAKNDFTLMEEDPLAVRIEADLMKLINDDLEKETLPESQSYRALVEFYDPTINPPPGFEPQVMGRDNSGYQDENMKAIFAVSVKPPASFTAPSSPYESIYALFPPANGLLEGVYPSFQIPPPSAAPSFAGICLLPPHLYFAHPKQGCRF